MLRTDIEYAVHCETDWTVIGPISKTHAHLSWARETLTHYSTRSMLYNPQLQKRWLQLKNEQKWSKRDMWVAWHNCYVQDGDSWRVVWFQENLAKEAKEEIWMDLTMYETLEDFLVAMKESKTNSFWYIFDSFHYQTETNNEYVWLGLIVTNEESFDYPDGEVVDFQWLSSDELQDFLNADNRYCCPLPMVFKKAQVFIETHLSS